MKTQMKSMMWFLTLVALFSSPHLASAYYDPGVQRWINRDPVREPGFEVVRDGSGGGVDGTPNGYGFVGNDPVSSTDPLGLEYGTGFAAYQRCINDCEGIRTPCNIAVTLIGILGGGGLGSSPGKGGGVLGAACGAILGRPMDRICDDAVAACKQACEKQTKYSPGKNKPRPRAHER